jgi:hypothetical protein
VFPLHILYHLYNGVSFSIGTFLFAASKRLGIVLPGTLPLEPWPAGALTPVETPLPDGVRTLGRDRVVRAADSSRSTRQSVRRAV